MLQQDPSLLAAALPAASGDGERSVLVAIAAEADVDALLAIAEPLARHPPRVLVLARLVRDPAELAPTAAWLAERASALKSRGIVVRTASFTTTEPGAELARLASDFAVDLLLGAAPDELLDDGLPDPQLDALLAGTPCDVALLEAASSDSRRNWLRLDASSPRAGASSLSATLRLSRRSSAR